MKGAIREIRKDNAFIAREKLKEQIDRYEQDLYLFLQKLLKKVIDFCRDNQRKRKVKELLGSLANQEGEVRKLKKTKKK